MSTSQFQPHLVSLDLPTVEF